MMLRRPRNHFRLKFRKSTTSRRTRHLGRHLQIVNSRALSQPGWPLIVCIYLLQALTTIIQAIILIPLEVLVQNLSSLSSFPCTISELGCSQWAIQERAMYRRRPDWPSKRGVFRRRPVMWSNDVMWPSQLRCACTGRYLSNVWGNCFHFRTATGDSLKQPLRRTKVWGSSSQMVQGALRSAKVSPRPAAPPTSPLPPPPRQSPSKRQTQSSPPSPEPPLSSLSNSDPLKSTSIETQLPENTEPGLADCKATKPSNMSDSSFEHMSGTPTMIPATFAMPRPGQPGALQFDGTNVTEFLENWELMCEDYGLKPG